MTKNRCAKHALVLIVVLAMLALPALALAEPLEIISDPSEETEVSQGDIINYRLEIREDIQLSQWSLIRVTFGEGMQFVDGTLKYLDDGDEETSTQVQFIPGNDGCVITASAVRAGDVYTFSALVAEENALATVEVKVDGGASAQAAHVVKFVPTPEPTPAAQETPEPTPEQAETAGSGSAVINVILIVLCLGVFILVATEIMSHPIIRRKKQPKHKIEE